MDVKDIMELLGEITIKTGLPVPIDKSKIFEWANNFNINRKGEIYLYTGALYQLIPYINYTVKYLDSISKLPSGDSLINLAKIIIKISPYYLSSIIKPSIKEINENNAIVRNIAKLLIKIDKNIAYLYEDDIYSGVLLYDMGLDDYFSIHSQKVFKSFKNRNVKKIITIDPHTTHVMREGYQKFVDNYDIEVINYLELLSNTNIDLGKLNKTLTIHDPCVYSRYENIVDQPRKLLKSMGIRIKEPKRSGKNTYCCGGPLESLSPKFSEDIAKSRIDQLLSQSDTIITMCPICKANLSRVKPDYAKLIDISEILTSNI